MNQLFLKLLARKRWGRSVPSEAYQNIGCYRECNYKDNYYGDQYCIATSASSGAKEKLQRL